jgi:roadblock/LC7 domain-containing protein
MLEEIRITPVSPKAGYNPDGTTMNYVAEMNEKLAKLAQLLEKF